MSWLPKVADEVTVVHNGSHSRPAPAVAPEAPSTPPYALMLGTIEPRKNLPLALDALRILRRRASTSAWCWPAAIATSSTFRPSYANGGWASPR